MAPSTPQNPEGRNVSEAEVEATIQDPDISYTDPVGKPTYVRHINGRRIKVVGSLLKQNNINVVAPQRQ